MRKRRRPKKTLAFLAPFRPYYDRFLEKQGGVCGVCGRPPSPNRKLDMDHDHHGMYVRGLLCHRCNRALPSWMDSKWLRAAADYLDAATAASATLTAPPTEEE